MEVLYALLIPSYCFCWISGWVVHYLKANSTFPGLRVGYCSRTTKLCRSCLGIFQIISYYSHVVTVSSKVCYSFLVLVRFIVPDFKFKNNKNPFL